jgi:hypothetical protein
MYKYLTQQIDFIAGTVKMNVAKAILWEVDLMITQEEHNKLKSPNNMLIW